MREFKFIFSCYKFVYRIPRPRDKFMPLKAAHLPPGGSNVADNIHRDIVCVMAREDAEV